VDQDPAAAPAPSLIDKAKALNPFAKVADVLGKAAAPPPTLAPAKPMAVPTGPSIQVDWVDPATGKRMSGTAAERDAALKKSPSKPAEKPKSPAVPRSMSKR